MNTVMVTGSAGFIGFHFSKYLLENNFKVIGVDNLNNYYDVSLKQSRNNQLLKNKNYCFEKIDISNMKDLNTLSSRYKIDSIVNLAAQAGVQYSIKNPQAYIESNILGFNNILEIAKDIKVKHLVYASSSSVYGMNKSIPFQESQNVDHPISLYAATKKSNELMAHAYSYIYDLPTTGLRFFTVYGPWGRPDMALFKFTEAMTKNKSIQLNNNGNHARDFTYIDDIVNGIFSVLKKPPIKDPNAMISPSSSSIPWKVLNIGRGQKIELMSFIEIIEKYFNRDLQKSLVPLQVGDVENTFCDTSILESQYGYSPKVNVEEGVKKFLDWYVTYYNIDMSSYEV